MAKKYTVSELSSKLGVSVNTTWKKIKKGGLTTVKESVNNREITFVLLDDDQFSDLINDGTISNPINNRDYEHNYEDFETIHEGVNLSQTPSELIMLVDKVMDYSREMNNHIKEYVERVVESDKKVKLLEDSENRKNDEYHRLIAENKSLRLKITKLEERVKYYESKWWNKSFNKGDKG